jgi:hypothetical protein
MKQTKLFKILTITLLVANAILMSVLIFNNGVFNKRCKSENHREKTSCDKDNSQFCKKDGDQKNCKNSPTFFSQLNLDSTQELAFTQQAETYKARITAIRLEIKENMNLYFADLKIPTKNADKEVLIAKIQELQKNKIEITYAHFDSLKSLLKEEQKENFNKHIDKAMKCILAKSCDDAASFKAHEICHK